LSLAFLSRTSVFAALVVTIAFFKAFGPRQFNAWFAYAGIVFLAALPVATFWPS
jgi:hypothetical protein